MAIDRASSTIGSRRRLPAAKRREAILIAAEEAFSRSTFHETSLEGVAERAGVSKALIYEHFSSKRELHRCLLSARADELLDRVTAAIAAASGREERLRVGIEAYLDFVIDHPGASKLLFSNSTDPDVVGELDRLREETATMIATLISDEIPPTRSESELPVEAAVAMLAHQLIGALQALSTWWGHHPEAEREHVLRMAMEYSWLGLDRLSLGEIWQP